MLKNKFTRHTLAFSTIAIASVFLYPAVGANATMLTWVNLGLIGLAAIITLTTK